MGIFDNYDESTGGVSSTKKTNPVATKTPSNTGGIFSTYSESESIPKPQASAPIAPVVPSVPVPEPVSMQKRPSFSQEVMKKVTGSLFFGPIAPVVETLAQTKKGKEVIGKAQEVKQIALDKTINQPKVQKAIVATSEVTSGGSIIPAVKSIFGEAFDMGMGRQDAEDVVDRFERYKTEFSKNANDPNSKFTKKLAYSIMDSGPQTITGVLLGAIPLVGPAVSSTYFGGLSASEQIQEQGKVTSPLKIAIDTVGDRILGTGIEGLLKKPAKDLVKTGFIETVKNFGKGAITEGSTESAQSLLKFAVDYQNAKTPEQKQTVVQKTKDYVTKGGLFLEFTTGAILGGGISGVAGTYNPEQTNYVPRKTFSKKDDEFFNDGQNKTREQVRDVVNNEINNGTDDLIIAKGLSDSTGIDTQTATQIVNEIKQDSQPEQQTSDLDIYKVIQEASQEVENATVTQEQTDLVNTTAEIENSVNRALGLETEAIKSEVKKTNEKLSEIEKLIKDQRTEGYSDFEIAKKLQKDYKISLKEANDELAKYGETAKELAKQTEVKPTEAPINGTGLTITGNEVFDNGKKVGDLIIEKDNKNTINIRNIDTTGNSGVGYGTKIIKTIFENNPNVNRITGDSVKESLGFWEKIGAKMTQPKRIDGGEGSLFKLSREDFFNKTSKKEPLKASNQEEKKTVTEQAKKEASNKPAVNKEDKGAFELLENEGEFKVTTTTYKLRETANVAYSFLDKKQKKEYDSIKDRMNYGTKEEAQKQLDDLIDFENRNKEAFVKAKETMDKWEEEEKAKELEDKTEPLFTPAEFNEDFDENPVVFKAGQFVIDKNGDPAVIVSGNDEWVKDTENPMRDANIGSVRTRYIGQEKDYIGYANQLRHATATEIDEIKKMKDYAPAIVPEQKKLFQTKKKVRTKKGFISSQEALEKALDIPVFKELQARGQVVLSEKLNNPKALASYYKGVIKFINNPHETTLPHEAFHAFADLVLTTDEKSQALELVRETGMGDLQAEEKLAQDFAEWYVGKQKQTTLEKIFDKIKAFFNKLVGNRNQIEALFESVLDEKLVRSINSFEKLGGIDELRREYNQSPEEFTYELFEKSDIWKKPTLKRATIIGALGSLRKPLMKEFVATKLDTDFAGQEVIDTEELRRSIYSDLLDMKIIESSRYADYGLSNIGTTTNSAKTYILNTNFLHGRTGHFSGEFKTTTTSDDLEIRVIKAGMHDGQRVDEDQYYVTRKDLNASNLVEGTFGKFNTRDEAQAYIDGFSDMSQEQAGLFGHFRAYQDSSADPEIADSFNVVEMQSDVFQDLSASYFRSNKRLMENELKIVQDDINQAQKVVDRYKEARSTQEARIDEFKKGIKDFNKNDPQYKLFTETENKKIDALKELVADNEQEIAKKQDYIDRQEKELEKIKAKYTLQPEGVFFGKAKEYSLITDSVIDLQDIVNGIEKKPNVTPSMSFMDSSITRLLRKNLVKDKFYVQLWSPYTESIQDREVNLSDYNSQSMDALLENGKEYGYKNRQIIKNRLQEIIKEAKGNLPSKEEFLKLTPQEEREVKLSEQFISFKNNYYETIINSTIRQAAMEDARVIRFATPYTVANVEGYIANDEYGEPEGDYTEQEVDDIGVGGEIEIMGYTGIVTSIDNNGYNVVYSDSRDGLSRPITEDDIIEGEKEIRTMDFNVLEDLADVKQTFSEHVDASSDGLSQKEIDAIHEKIREATDIESLENINGFETVKEEMIDTYMENFNAYEYMRDIYGSNGFASYAYKGTTYYVDGAGNDVTDEYIAYKTSFSGTADEFKLSDIGSDEHRAIAAKYGTDDEGKDGAFLKYIKRKRKDLREVVDENGFSWYESNITPEDKASVELYQTEDQISSDDAWQENEIDIMTGKIKIEDMKPVEKNPVFNTGDKVEDAKRALLFAENRVGIKTQPVRKINVSGAKIELPENLQSEMLALELEGEYIEQNPLNDLWKYADKRNDTLPEVTGKDTSVFAQKGDDIVNNGEFQMYADSDGHVLSETVRDAFRGFVDQKRSYIERLKQNKGNVRSFKNREKDKLALEKLNVQQDKKNIVDIKAREKTEDIERRRKIADQAIENAKKEEEAKQARIRTINQAKTTKIKELSFLDKMVGQSLNPLKYTDKITQNIFNNWNKKIQKGSIRADKEAKEFTNIPITDGIDTILKYEAGEDTKYSKDIKEKFDALRDEAQTRGVDLGFRENYLPHVYNENAKEIGEKIRKYLTDKGLTEDQITAYENGEMLPESITKALKINPFFSKERVFPTYKVAMEYGLTPKYTNVAQLVGHYVEELETIVANNELVTELEQAGKILPFEDAPILKWDMVNLPFSKKGYMAPPNVARVINGLFGKQEPTLWTYMAKLSKKMQEIKLSAGLPYTTVNFFAIGQLVKEITAGNFKATNAFFRANFDRKSMSWLEENRNYIYMMAKQGINLRETIDSWENLYNNLSDIKGIGNKSGEIFDRAFNKKTFMSFMPMMQIQLFKDTYNAFIKKGYTADIAEEFAGRVVSNNFGLSRFSGRSKTTQDKLSAVFFAPTFREGIINTLFNTGKAGADIVKNAGGLRVPLDPALIQNRKLLAGMTISYVLYTLLNAGLNDDGDDENGKEWMSENPKNRKFALRIPTDDGTIVYIEFMPSFLAFARNMFSGTYGLATGDFDTAKQKYGSVFSMPIKTASEIWANADYFDRPIYKETDTGAQKTLKIAKYLGLSVMHPYITETINQIQDKKPLYQSVVTGLELPLKFSTKDKEATSEYYDALDKKAKENARAKEKVQPIYDKVQELKAQNKYTEATALVNNLSEDDQIIYNKIKQNPYEKKKEKIALYEDAIKSLETKTLSQVEKDIATQLYGNDVTKAQRSIVNKDFGYYKEFNGYKYKTEADELKALDNDNKVLYLKSLKNKLSPTDYNEFIKKGRTKVRLSSGASSPILISDDVLKQIR